MRLKQIPDGKWYSFHDIRGSRQKLPSIGKLVLVLVEGESDFVRIVPEFPPIRSQIPAAIAVGYRKNNAGDKQSPYFVIPSVGRKVIAWCDCLDAVLSEKDCLALYQYSEIIEAKNFTAMMK